MTQKQPWIFPLTPPLDSVRIKTSSSTQGVFQVFKQMKSILPRFSISQNFFLFSQTEAFSFHCQRLVTVFHTQLPILTLFYCIFLANISSVLRVTKLAGCHSSACLCTVAGVNTEYELRKTKRETRSDFEFCQKICVQ